MKIFGYNPVCWLLISYICLHVFLFRLLTMLVGQHGLKKWSQIAQLFKGRVGKQCRERWHNHLRPNIKVHTFFPSSCSSSPSPSLPSIHSYRKWSPFIFSKFTWFPTQGLKILSTHCLHSMQAKIDEQLPYISFLIREILGWIRGFTKLKIIGFYFPSK